MKKANFPFICLPAVQVGLLILILLCVSCAFKRRLPKPAHIVIVMEENHGFDQIIGSENAPYINRLAKEGTLFTDAHSITHPSEPNYLALFSGSTQGVDGDQCLTKECTFNSA